MELRSGKGVALSVSSERRAEGIGEIVTARDQWRSRALKLQRENEQLVAHVASLEAQVRAQSESIELLNDAIEEKNADYESLEAQLADAHTRLAERKTGAHQ